MAKMKTLREKIESGDKIRVLGIYPEAGPSFWNQKGPLRIAGKKAPMPPTGLLTVLAMLPDRFEALPVLDLNTEGLSSEKLGDADLIFTSSMIAHQRSHNDILEMARDMKVPVVAGGPLPTAYPERVNANYIVAGEAEITLGPFLADFLEGNAHSVYTERDCLNGVDIELTREGKPLLKYTPLPRWDLINLKDYFTIGIQYSRGCPNHCEFCDIPELYGHIPRTKSPERIVEELKKVSEMGFRGQVFLVDDNFIGNKREVMKALPEIAKYQKATGYQTVLNTEASLNLAWPENKGLREAMIDAGFNHVFVGIESPDPDVIKKMKKEFNLRMTPLDAVRTLQESGLGVTSGFIIGNDGERKTIFEDMYNFIQASGIVDPMVGLLGVGKGTPLYDRLKIEGRLKSSETNGTNTHNFHLDYIPSCELNEGEIVEGYKGLLKRLFLDDKNYYARCKVYHNVMGENRASSDYGVNWETVSTFGRFLKYMAFGGGASVESLKYLGETLLRDPKRLSHAVVHVVKHGHFKEVTRASLDMDAFAPQIESWYEGLCEKTRTLMDKYKNEPDKAMKAVTRATGRVLKKAENAYKGLHYDFRDGASSKLSDLRDRIARKDYLPMV